MSAQTTQARRGRLNQVRPGRRLAIASLLMVPLQVVLYVPLYAIGSALQSALGLAEDEMLTEAGVWGVAAAALVIVLAISAPIVGMLLGVKARGLGERRLGTIGVGVNAAIAAYSLLTSVLNLVFS